MALEPLAGLRVVDLFAGSGALGIESLSRGAAHAHFVEAAAAALHALEENLEVLGLRERSTVWRARWPRIPLSLRSALAESELILVDPPYGGELSRGVIDVLGGSDWLRAGARLVVEHHAKDELPERSGRLARERIRRYGETVVSCYRATPSDADPRPKGSLP